MASDLIRLYILACEEPGETVGVPRCCYGTQHSLRKWGTYHTYTSMAHDRSRSLATHRRSLSFQKRLGRRLRHTERACCLRGLHSSSFSTIRYDTFYLTSQHHSSHRVPVRARQLAGSSLTVATTASRRRSRPVSHSAYLRTMPWGCTL